MTKILLAILLHSLSGVYDFTLTANDQSTIHLSDYSGKRILIVNTATGSPYASQYGDLETLYQQNKDSLVIIAVPSNSFGDEPNADSAINNTVQTTYGIHYVLAAKSVVTGIDQLSLYSWLTSFDQNGMFGSGLKGSFQKFLIDSQGKLVGVFAPSVSPLGDEMSNALKNNP